jgi:Fungal protein kinase
VGVVSRECFSSRAHPSPGHHEMWKATKYLHQDISDASVMFCLRYSLETPNKRTVIGILIDWGREFKMNDKGCSVEPSNRDITPRALPFTPLNLIDRDPPPLQYRHNLESFLYLLLYAMVCYDIANGTRLPLPKELEDWEGPSISRASGFKAQLLSSVGYLGIDTIAENVREEWWPLFEKWGLPLFNLLQLSNSAETMVQAISGLPLMGEEGEKLKRGWMNLATATKRLTFENFMEAIGETPEMPD